MNAAALTNVDEAEREPARAHAINGVAPGVMAQASRHVGAVMMHYSTDYVFDGAATTPYHESAAPGPINVYGASKLAGERNVAAANGPYLIIRTSWVYSAGGTGFVATLLRELPTTERIRVVEDQVGSPTWSRSLAMATAEILWKITDHGGDALSRTDWGVYHLAGSGQASRVEIAHAVLDTLAEQGETIRAQIVPVTAATFGALAPRPRYTALSNERISARLGVSLPPWRTALRQMLNARVR
jgi:dTDP-4-dehydrorhamnose reductase